MTTEANLFDICDGILSGDYAEQTLASTDEVINYAEAAGASITEADAQRIIEVGKHWLDRRENGNGEWSRMRDEARDALSDE